MHRCVALCAIFASAAACLASDPIPRGEYRSRRVELRKTLEGPLVLFGRFESPDEVFRIDQEPNFYYLTGWEQPGAILLLSKSEEILFLPHRNSRREMYVGRRTAPEESATGESACIRLRKFLGRTVESLAQKCAGRGRAGDKFVRSKSCERV